MHNYRYFLNHILPVRLLDFFSTTLECSLHFYADLLPQVRSQFDVDIRFEERRADLLQE
jgi:hypothetical protein